MAQNMCNPAELTKKVRDIRKVQHILCKVGMDGKVRPMLGMAIPAVH